MNFPKATGQCVIERYLSGTMGKFDFNSCVDTHRCVRKRIYHECEVLI